MEMQLLGPAESPCAQHGCPGARAAAGGSSGGPLGSGGTRPCALAPGEPTFVKCERMVSNANPAGSNSLAGLYLCWAPGENLL